MNIKQSVSLLFILMSVSFSSNAENVYRVYMVSWGGAPLKEGQIITDSYISSIRFSNFSNCRAIFNRIECDQSPYSRRTEIGRMNRLTCPDGQELDPITGQCEPKPYCEEQSTIDAMSQYHDSCTAKGGTPKIFCDNNTQSFDADCELPDQPCDPDSDDWPACMDDDPEPDQCDSTSPDWVDSEGKCCNESNNYCDEKPPEPCTIFNRDAPHCQNDDDDIEPPTPDDDLDPPEFPDFPDTDGSGNSDIPEPPVDNESDANKAIKALNKDMNKQLTQINNDLNGNHEISMKALGSLKSSLDLNTKSVVDGANHTASAVNSQTSVLTELGNKTNGLLKSINGLLKGGFDGLNESLEGLKDAFKVDPVAVNPKHLYESGDLSRLRSEVESLKSDYEAELRSMKSYFNFTSGVSSGDFNSHDLALNWHGHAVTATNQVFVSMRDNAGIIAAVVLFGFGMAGIKEIMRA
ncbi:hypothetical protein BTO00_14175 [Vibrio campbellii]|uniref:hypothetical protein n=1 Tax=Vibrio campbellii TaxID=680 RepID=UPI000CF41B6F|nr:hypothetical protein [Vibrio campbellii]PQJ43146.1 hypothetical protein BTO00_14175 [Vibrio campbellii]